MACAVVVLLSPLVSDPPDHGCTSDHPFGVLFGFNGGLYVSIGD